MSNKILYASLIVISVLFIGGATQAKDFLPSIMLLLTKDKGQEVTIDTSFDQVKLDTVTFE